VTQNDQSPEDLENAPIFLIMQLMHRFRNTIHRFSVHPNR